MGRLTKGQQTITTSDVTLTTNTVIVPTHNSPGYLDMQQALCGSLHAKVKCTTAGTAGKIFHFYLLFSKDGITFDTANTAMMTEIGNFPVQADTNEYDVTIPLDGVTMAAPFARLAMMCDNASNYGTLKYAYLCDKRAS